MMSTATSILILEMAVVLLLIICILIFFEWKRRKKTSSELEHLLEAVNEQQDDRKKKLIQMLVDDYSLDVAEAAESGEYMVEAEKQYIQQFAKQQLENTTVAESYLNLCELLDQYLYFIPNVIKEEKNIEESSETEKAELSENIDEPETIETENISEQQDITEPVVDQDVDKQAEKKVEEVGESEEEEPDWGDAFAESGDDMDEEVKQGYEDDAKKEE